MCVFLFLFLMYRRVDTYVTHVCVCVFLFFLYIDMWIRMSQMFIQTMHWCVWLYMSMYNAFVYVYIHCIHLHECAALLVHECAALLVHMPRKAFLYTNVYMWICMDVK